MSEVGLLCAAFNVSAADAQRMLDDAEGDVHLAASMACSATGGNSPFAQLRCIVGPGAPDFALRELLEQSRWDVSAAANMYYDNPKLYDERTAPTAAQNSGPVVIDDDEDDDAPSSSAAAPQPPRSQPNTKTNSAHKPRQQGVPGSSKRPRSQPTCPPPVPASGHTPGASTSAAAASCSAAASHQLPGQVPGQLPGASTSRAAGRAAPQPAPAQPLVIKSSTGFIGQPLNSDLLHRCKAQQQAQGRNPPATDPAVQHLRDPITGHLSTKATPEQVQAVGSFTADPPGCPVQLGATLVALHNSTAAGDVQKVVWFMQRFPTSDRLKITLVQGSTLPRTPQLQLWFDDGAYNKDYEYDGARKLFAISDSGGATTFLDSTAALMDWGANGQAASSSSRPNDKQVIQATFKLVVVGQGDQELGRSQAGEDRPAKRRANKEADHVPTLVGVPADLPELPSTLSSYAVRVEVAALPSLFRRSKQLPGTQFATMLQYLLLDPASGLSLGPDCDGVLNFCDAPNLTEGTTAAKDFTAPEVLDSVQLPALAPAAARPEALHQTVPKLFQLQGLQWMLDREQKGDATGRGILQLDPRWLQLVTPGGFTFYVKRTGGTEVSIRFRPINVATTCGGFLCDEMGLGKTLQTIMLILSNPEPMDWPHPNKGALHWPPGAPAIPIKTTLVVVPATILHQWKDEIQRHVKPGALKCCVYNVRDARASGNVRIKCRAFDGSLVQLHECDVCLMSYTDMLSELRAHGQRKAPLRDYGFWRVVLDEAQMVAASNSAAAIAASSLYRRHAWVVTGTPVSKSLLAEVQGLCMFLALDPMCESSVWKKLVADPFQGKTAAGLQAMRSLLQSAMLRRSKASVQEQLHLPPCIQEDAVVTLSTVEREVYEHERHKFREALARYQLESSVADGNTIGLQGRLNAQLAALRQSCCHPQASVRVRAFAGQARTDMGQIMEELVRDGSSTFLTLAAEWAALKLLDIAAGGRSSDTAAVDEADDQLKKMLVNVATALSTMHLKPQQLISLWRDDGTLVAPDAVEAMPLAEPILQEAKEEGGKVRVVKDKLKELKSQKEDLQERIEHPDGAEEQSSAALKKELARVRGSISAAKQELAKHEAQRKAIEAKVDAIQGPRKPWLRRLEEGLALRHHLKCRKTKDAGTAQCMQEFSMDLMWQWVADLGLHPELELDLLSRLKRNVTIDTAPEASTPPSTSAAAAAGDATAGTSAAAAAAAMAGAADVEATAVFGKHRAVTQLKRSLLNKKARAEAAAQLQQADRSMQDKLHHVRHLISTQARLVAASSASSSKTDGASSSKSVPAGDPAAASGSGSRDREADRTCCICLDVIEQITVTSCGHYYCTTCIREAVEARGDCPVCRTKLKQSDLHDACTEEEALERQRRQAAGAAGTSSREDEHQFGAKVARLLQLLEKQEEEEPGSQAVVFSSWPRVLNLVSEALNSRGIVHASLAVTTLAAKQEALTRFQGDAGCRVLLMQMANHTGAAGLNLTCASRAYLMEPAMSPAIEAQAAARIYRLGQKRTTRVVRLVAEGTVEGMVLQLQAQRALAGSRLAIPGEQGAEVPGSTLLQFFSTV